MTSEEIKKKRLSMLKDLGLVPTAQMRKIGGERKRALESYNNRYKAVLEASEDYVKDDRRKYGGSLLPGNTS